MESQTLTAQEARRKLQETRHRNVPFKQKARTALRLGERYLGATNAHLTQIDTETNHQEVIVSTDPQGGRLPEGFELDRQTTCCRRTIETDGPVTLHDTSTQGQDSALALEAHSLDWYYGTTLYLEGEPYGTICFVADDSRDKPFETDENMFVDLIGQLLEQELERQQHQTEITRRNNLLNVLNRVLRHNIRNDMSVIRGRTQLMADQLEDSTTATGTIDRIDDLIQLCQKAREVEQIVDQSNDRTQTNIETLLNAVVSDVTAEFPEASITFSVDADATVTVLPSFERGVRELVENAAKHGGESSSVTIDVEDSPQGVVVHVTDTGPGLPKQERKVLQAGVETPLIHGSGLGLWLAHWIVAEHDGTIEATVTDTGTRVSMSVPRSPATSDTQDLVDLRQARDRYKAAFEEAFDAQLLVDDKARIIEANPEAETIYGLDRTELRGRSLDEFFPEEFDFDAAWTVFQNNGTERNIVPIVGADGQRRQIEYSATADVVPGQHLVISRDVTERRQRKTDLERYETVLDTINDAAWVYDDTKQITFVNQASLRMIPLSRERIVGTSLGDLERFFEDSETFDTWKTLVEDVLTGDVAEGDLDATLNLGGDRIIMNLRVTPIPDSDTPTDVAVIARDITARKKRERTLEEYETIIESLGDAVYVVDENGRFTYVNDEFVTLVGYDRETIIGNTPSLIKSAENVEQAHHQLGRLLSSDGPETVSFEMTIHPRDGDPITCRDNMCVLPYEGDEFEGSVGTLRDITDRKRRERQLAALKKRYETLIESAPNPVFVADYETGEILETNAAAETMLGKSRERIVGQHQTELHPSDQTDLYRRFFEEYGRSGKTLRRLPDGSRIYVTDSSGTHIPVEISVCKISLPSGPAAVGIFRDVTEFAEQQRALKKRNSRLNALFEKAPDPIFVHDVAGNITDVNEAAIDRLGYAREELLSMTIPDIEIGASPEELRAKWETMDPGTNERFLGTQVRADGSTVPVEVWISPMELDGEKQLIAHARDDDSRQNRSKRGG